MYMYSLIIIRIIVNLDLDIPVTHILVKGQGHTKLKNVQNMLSHGHTPIWQNFACLYQREKTFSQTQIHVENIILILRSKTKVIQSSWMYATHRTMVIHSCAKQSTMSKDQKSEAWTQSSVIHPLTLWSKINVVSKSRIYLTHSLMVIDPCAKYGMTLSELTEVADMKTRQNINLTLTSKVNIKSWIWMYVSHHLMAIDQCAKYGKLM